MRRRLSSQGGARGLAASTFNLVQEHLVRSGDRYLGYTEDMGIQQNRTRAVARLGESQKLNKLQWALATEFAQN